MKPRHLTIWLSAAVVVSLAGCRAQAPAGADLSRPATPRCILWAIPGELRIDPITGKPHNPHVRDRDWREANSVWSAAEKTVSLAGARNEWLGFQLIIEAAGEDLRYVNVKFTDLTGPGGRKIPARDVKLFRVWYTEVTEPSRSFDARGGYQSFNALGVPSVGTGWYGDALIPFHVRGWGGRFSVAKGRNQAVWADVKVAKKLPAGTYRGKVTVRADRAAAVEANVALTVWDFDIPDKLNARGEGPLYRATIPSMWGVRADSDRGMKIERQFFRMARAHRFIPYIYDCFPKVEGEGLEIKIDWTSHDKRFGPYFDGSAFDDKIPIQQWNVPVDTYWPSSRGWADSRPKDYYGRISRVIQQYDEHFKAKGWKPRMYVFFQGLDEPSTEERFAKVVKVAQAVKEGSKRVKVRHDFYTAFAEGDKMIERFRGSIDIWCISSCFYPVEALQARQAKGEEAWYYQGAEPWVGAENLDNEAIGLRTWAWIAWKYRVDCWHNWCSGRWGGENIFVWPNNGGSRGAWRPNGNGVMVYPGILFGVDELFPSVRLKAYRRGNTDYEYMVLLKKLGQGKTADDIVNSIVRKALGEAGNDKSLIGKFGDWSHDPDEWVKARAKLAAAILKARKAAP